MPEHRIISPDGEVRLAGDPPKRRGNRQRNNRQAKAAGDPHARVSLLLRRLRYQMAPWREQWDWRKIGEIERQIDKLLG